MIPQKQGASYDANPLDDLPDLPDLPGMKPEDKSKLDEWWRQVRVVLDRWRDEEVKQ
jgi:hypothetical protein